MPYCTLDLLTDRFGARMLIGLTDRAELATGTVDTDVVDRAIADADAVIDGHLRTRYALPMAEPIPALLTDIAMSIVGYKLHTSQPNPKIETDYKDALRHLEAIAKGTIQLSAAGLSTGGAATGSGARITDRERPFTEANLKGFI